MILRDECPGDEVQIHAVTKAAFAGMPFSNGTEPHIVDALRTQNQLTLSIVAAEDKVIIGQITFSAVTINGLHDGVFGLGPVSVLPEHQNQGVGSALIYEGLSRLKHFGAKECVLVGNPDYYSRFGFIADGRLKYAEIDKRYIQRLTFVSPARGGDLQYCDAFENAAAS